MCWNFYTDERMQSKFDLYSKRIYFHERKFSRVNKPFSMILLATYFAIHRTRIVQVETSNSISNLLF